MNGIAIDGTFQKYKTGGQFVPRELRSKSGSRTPGKTKNENCQTDVTKKYMAKRSRSYKDPLYHLWDRKTKIANGVKV